MFLYFRCECAVRCDWWVSVEYRAVIMLMFLKGNTPQTILEEMTAVSRLVSTSPYSVSHYWYSHFRCGWMLVETVTIPLSQLLRVTIILVKCCLTIQKLADRVSGKKKKIIHDLLHMQKCQCGGFLICSTLSRRNQLLLAMCQENQTKLFAQLITQDESCVKAQSK